MEEDELAPRIDHDYLLELVEGDRDLARDLLESLWRDSSTLEQNLRHALATRDAFEVGRIGHALKGAAANLGATALREVGSNLQVCGEVAEFEVGLRWARTLARENEALAQFLGDLASSG